MYPALEEKKVAKPVDTTLQVKVNKINNVEIKAKKRRKNSTKFSVLFFFNSLFAIEDAVEKFSPFFILYFKKEN
jgi:hypothetical protein